MSCEELLSYEELTRIVSVAVHLGMSKVRLTGGEPLVRKGVMHFIKNLSQIEGLQQIRLTTNGVLLPEHGEELFANGVGYLNISLDTLNEKKFEKITGRPFWKKVRGGIEKALDTGFKIKLNVVAMKGINDDEFLDFAAFALEKSVQVRFIEFMPIGTGTIWNKEYFISAETIRKRIEKQFNLQPLPGSRVEGPARMYSITDKLGRKGRVGFISPLSQHFCDSCNRLRLTSAGKLRACLLHDRETDLRAILRNNCSDHDIEMAIRDTILFKPKGHNITNGPTGNEQSACCRVGMSRIGG